MKKILLLLLSICCTTLCYAQAAGGQIKRPVKKLSIPSVSRTVNKRPSSSTYSKNVGKSSDAGVNATNDLLAEEMCKKGDDYYYGRGVTCDYSEAVKWYRKAAEQGYASAQFNLGYCYYFGKGTSEDRISAKNWMEKAAANGHSDAKKFLQRNTFQTVITTSQSLTDCLIEFTLYGTKLQVRFDVSKRVKVRDGNQDDITKCLDWLVSSIKETSEDCLRIKKDLNLSDWAFMKMLDQLSAVSLGNTNEAVLLMSLLMVDAGYDVRLAKLNDGKLRLLYYTDATVYGSMFFQLEGRNYYLYGSPVQDKKVTIGPNYSEGKPVDFRYQGEMLLAKQQTEPLTLKSSIIPDFSFTVQMNKNLIDYYGDIPSVYTDDNFMTRWGNVASFPLEKQLNESLITKMKQRIWDFAKSQEDAVQLILWWVQTAFVSSDDEEVWGADRVFYAEETLFYPSSDCEDRAILFSRLVRDVLGLDVALVYYPQYLATAVHFTESDVKGASVDVNGQRFVICDPSEEGLLVGQENSDMQGKEKTTLLLGK